MNLGSSAAAHPPSPGILVPNVSRIRTDTSERNSPTGNGRPSIPTSASPRPKGKGRAKKRKTAKSSKVSNHPSVVIATSWTDRQEQFEELRAREAVYCSQRSCAVVVDTLDTHGNSKARWTESVGICKAGSNPRVRRPWEWSAQDCQTLMYNAPPHPQEAPEKSLEEILGIDDESAAPGLSCATKPASLPGKPHPQEAPEKSLEEILGIDDESAAPGLSCATKPASLPGNVTGEAISSTRAANIIRRKKKKTEELPRKKTPARRVRGRCNGSTGMRTADALGRSSSSSSGVNNGQSEGGASTVSTDDTPLAKEQEVGPAKRKHFGSTASSSADKGNVHKDKLEVRPAGPLADNPSEEVDAMEDEKKARELSAALNRNIPRQGRFQRNPHVAEGERDLGTHGKERPSKSKSIGKNKRSASLMRRRLIIDTGAPRGTSTVPFDSTAPRNELEMHPWISAGLDFGPGTMAEVWWEDEKWYRCRISTISHEGRCGELEFLPHRRKTIAREFSTELDLDELIRDGHLVLPGTHL